MPRKKDVKVEDKLKEAKLNLEGKTVSVISIKDSNKIDDIVSNDNQNKLIKEAKKPKTKPLAKKKPSSKKIEDKSSAKILSNQEKLDDITTIKANKEPIVEEIIVKAVAKPKKVNKNAKKKPVIDDKKPIIDDVKTDSNDIKSEPIDVTIEKKEIAIEDDINTKLANIKIKIESDIKAEKAALAIKRKENKAKYKKNNAVIDTETEVKIEIESPKNEQIQTKTAGIESIDENNEEYIVIDLNKKLSIDPVFANIKQKGAKTEQNEIELAENDEIDEQNPEIPLENDEIIEKPKSKNFKKNQKRKLAIKKAKELVVLNKAELIKTEQKDLDLPKIEEKTEEIEKIKIIKDTKLLSKSDIAIEISDNTAKYITKLEKDIIPVNLNDRKEISTVKINVSTKPHKHNQILNLNEKKQVEKRKTTIKRLIPDHSIIPLSKLLTLTERSNSIISSGVSKVDDFMRKELFVESGMKFILAVSGGVDSVVLLDIMAQLASRYYFTLYVSHFNHNLRGENSKKDEQFVKLLAESYKLNYYHSSGNVKQYSEKNSFSIEHSARILRYNFYERTARTINADFVASAHNANDSAETFLINLFRGAGLTGLSGIPSKRQLVKNVVMVRPLIGFKKAEIIEYAKERKLKWREDESNALMNYTRNKIRLDLLPKLMSDYNPSIIDTINRTSRLIQAADLIVDDIVKKNIATIVGDITPDRFYLKIPTLQTYDEFIQGELIQASMQKYFRSQPLNLNTIDRIISLLNSHTGSIAELGNNYFVLKDRDSLIFSKKTVDVDINERISKTGEFKIGKFKLILKDIKRSEVKFNNDPKIEYIDGDLLPNFLEIRNWEQGDSFQPLGMGTQKVSDYLTNIKMPLIDKPKVLVLKIKSEIIWLVGLRLSEIFKVTVDTKRIISAEIKIITEQK